MATTLNKHQLKKKHSNYHDMFVFLYEKLYMKICKK